MLLLPSGVLFGKGSYRKEKGCGFSPIGRRGGGRERGKKQPSYQWIQRVLGRQHPSLRRKGEGKKGDVYSVSYDTNSYGEEEREN